MTISPQTKILLERLVATGLYGANVEEVMERLICQQLQQLLKDRVLSIPEAPSGPRCVKCGSPRINNLSAMGTTEFQCLDCGALFAA